MKEANAIRPDMHVVASHNTLWNKFRQGDRHAFSSIYDTYIDDLYHYGMHFCQDNERVRDCLQDLFQDLWSSRSHLSENIINIKYYLISSLRRRLLRSLKNDRKREELLDFEFELTQPQETTLIRQETIAEQQKLLQQALNTLTRRQREAIYLRFYQSLSYKEVAEMMDMQVDSVYNTISKAITILKKTVTLPVVLFFLHK
ncbi:RNA polymerase sigma factor [Chitinophaga sp. Cy-1792]|uniref:RNA polymerase sigma factor n=1 Tax=Chitinophaga sp. Cy-1792 TaxID=2608339 RepID=UPI00141D869D|nr:sigma-70 family RNA polymerase sigma factor [Chitinophaga sp. Cy-1792]NIG54566.1 sigma-70 family RNA polymerase sigma factor [Chitinophaga sp. Cy-1792]